ncbi:MAG: hypothetical protein QM737_09470 [Ferruginibacter sp.]
MNETVLFIGNGINNINNNRTWEVLLNTLHKNYYDPKIPFDEIKQKPFPLVYEQIVAYQLKKTRNTKIESIVKKLIAEDVKKIVPNKVHERIIKGGYKNIITANYEFNLIKNMPAHVKNNGCVKETIYSVFRNFKVDGKNYWHLHGDAQNIHSINLGYEHYCGQLQKMREYVTAGYKSTNKKLSKKFEQVLLKRYYLNTADNHSWLDFFFKDNTTIKILGFRMELEEIDLWWLLTYRAKIMYGGKRGIRIPVNNKLNYYIPKKYTLGKDGKPDPQYKSKKDLMEKMDINVIEIDLPHNEDFYFEVLRRK